MKDSCKLAKWRWGEKGNVKYLEFGNSEDNNEKGRVIIYITVAPSEAVLAYVILQFCINIYNVYFNIPVSKAICQKSIKVRQRQQCRSTSENLIKFMVSDYFVYVFWSMAWMGMMNSHQVHFHITAQ